MIKNHKLLLKTVKEKTEKLLAQGLSIKQAEAQIMPILYKYKTQIDKGDTYGATLELNKI